MDWTVFVAPILSAVLSAIVASHVSATQMQTKIAVLESKFDDLSREVRKHNGVVERMTRLEVTVDSGSKSLWQAVGELRSNMDRMNEVIGHAPK